MSKKSLIIFIAIIIVLIVIIISIRNGNSNIKENEMNLSGDTNTSIAQDEVNVQVTKPESIKNELDLLNIDAGIDEDIKLIDKDLGSL